MPVDPAAVAELLTRDRAAGMAALDRALRALHESGESAMLSALHELATGVVGAGAEPFHLTQAYIFALDAGDAPRAADLRSRLVAMGRDIPEG